MQIKDVAQQFPYAHILLQEKFVGKRKKNANRKKHKPVIRLLFVAMENCFSRKKRRARTERALFYHFAIAAKANFFAAIYCFCQEIKRQWICKKGISDMNPHLTNANDSNNLLLNSSESENCSFRQNFYLFKLFEIETFELFQRSIISICISFERKKNPIN